MIQPTKAMTPLLSHCISEHQMNASRHRQCSLQSRAQQHETANATCQAQL